jgi:hypothetical protein
MITANTKSPLSHYEAGQHPDQQVHRGGSRFARFGGT